jgi:hypothetical protein
MAGWGSCDIAQLRRFAERMDGLQAGVDALATQSVQELAQRMLDKVTRRTPVGKKPKLEGPRTERVRALPQGGGRGRSYRVLTRNGAILERYWNGYVGGNLRRSWRVGNVARRGNVYEIEVFNAVEYVSYVEYGHRQRPGRYVPALGKQLKAGWVKGRFMLTVSEEELKVQAPAIVQKRLMEYFAGMER